MKNGWPVKRLGDLADLITKGTTPTSIGHSFVEDGIKFVKIESISTTGEFIEERLAHITSECHAVLGRSQLRAGDILFSIAGALGRTAFVTNEVLPANTNQALAIIRLRPSEAVLPRFVLKALATGVVMGQVEKFKGGVAQLNLSLAQVRDFRIALPPLPEQHRIVALLDEAFAGLAIAKANTERNLLNATALFETHLQSIFTQRKGEWIEERLGELAHINYGYTESASEKRVGPRFLRITDIRNNGVDWATVPYCPITSSQLPKYRLADGDIVFARTGATTGKSYLLANPPEAVFASYLIRVRLRESELLPQFVNLYFQTQSYWETIRTGVSGSAQGGFNATKLGELLVPYPKSLQEQRAIVARLDLLTSKTQRLANVYDRKLFELDALKRSLLHQAFNGELH